MMRRAVITTFGALAGLTATPHANAQTQTTNSVSYSIQNRGATTIQTTGGSVPMAVGYGRVLPTVSTTPSGTSLLSYRQNDVLVTESDMPGTTTMISGRTYAEVSSFINTGLAFANPNSTAIFISFTLTDRSGNSVFQSNFTLGANTQLARFLNESPFNAGAGFIGTFTFNASGPVAVTALRTLTNERNEFLFAPQNVIPLPDTSVAGTVLLAHFVDGGGWKTQVVLVNTTDAAISGTVQFFGGGTATAAASALTLTVNGQVGTSFGYTIPPRSSTTLQTSGSTGGAVQVGNVRITPANASLSPSGFAVLSLVTDGATVTLATVQAQRSGTAFRSYVEWNSAAANPGDIKSAIAIGNYSATAATVNFELTNTDGALASLTATATVPAFGQLSKFVQEVFPSIPLPFRGVLRVSSFSLLTVASFRARYNERGDFLITSMPVSNEALPSTTAELVFPHFVDGGGFSTQFVLFSGISGQISTGTLRFIGKDGQALNLTVR